ncbi:hypothetical protein WR25_16162 [Diploscapter pachys]|uniref:Serum response factor homolog n=1 Tax=Diploscapter pachys TaxID=2018661 RepID=A0A2A2JNY4_9BILA|nr:hypothetical protein WR25_16162 [Diploscapter pachys]
MTESPDLAQIMHQLQSSSSTPAPSEVDSQPIRAGNLLPNGKKTKGRVKIKMEYIGNKLRRYTTFSKRKTGIMKKAYELSTLTGTQVMLLVASETGHVYTYATKKLQPMIASETGKTLIQSCLSAPGDNTDCQPSRTEFTFECSGPGSGNSNARKRKATDNSEPEPTVVSIASFLPTMVPNTLFSNFDEDDYNQADSGDDSDSEEPMEEKEIVQVRRQANGKKEIKEEVRSETAKSEESTNETALFLQKHLKETLKDAASRRQKQQQSKAKVNTKTGGQATNQLLAPFILQGGANANNIMLNASSKGEEAPFGFTFPFQFNLQQLIEPASLAGQQPNSPKE